MIFGRGDGGGDRKIVLPLGDQMLPYRRLFDASPAHFAIRSRKLAARADLFTQSWNFRGARLANGLSRAIATEKARLRQRTFAHSRQRGQAIIVERTQ